MKGEFTAVIEAAEEGGENHPFDAVDGDRRCDEHDERAGRAADLEPAAAEKRHQEAADDGRDDPPVGRHAACDRDRHRQRQRDDGNGQTGNGIRPQLGQKMASSRRERAAEATPVGTWIWHTPH